MSDVFRLSANVSVDVDNVTRQLQQVQREGRNTGESLDRIDGQSIDVDISSAVSDLQRLESNADQVGDALKNAFAFEGVEGITNGFKGMVNTIMGLSDETMEYSNNHAKLKASLEATGHSTNWLQGQYEHLYGYIGDDMAVANTIMNMEKLNLSQSQTSGLTESMIAVWTAYGDSIPIEGLAESVDETVQVGKVTGSLADALNWAGVSEDDFNKKLEKCKTTQERAKLIQDTLNKVYGETKKSYDENTKGAREYQESQAKLMDSQSKLGEAMLPLNTAINNLKSAIANALIPVFKNLSPIIENIVKGIEWLVDKFNNLPQPVQTVITIVMALAGAITAIAGVIGIVTPIIGIFSNGFGLLFGAVSRVASFIPTLIGAISGISLPVVAVIAVIGSLIAIGVALYKNWDTIKAKATEIWKAISSTISNAWNSMKTTVMNGCNAIYNSISSKFNSAKNFMTNIWNSARNTMSNAWNSMKSTASNACSAIYNSISSKFNSAKNTISNVMNSARNIVSSGLSKIKGFFNSCHLKLPSIKLPVIRITGKFSINPPSAPHFGVSWKYFAKGGVLTKPTLFGMNGNTGLIGGEAGNEAVLPIDGFYDNLNNFLSKKLGDSNTTYNVNFNFSDIKIQNEQDIEKLAKSIDEKLQRIVNRKSKMTGGVVVG